MYIKKIVTLKFYAAEISIKKNIYIYYIVLIN